MNEEKQRILIVDDSPQDIQFVMENLKDEFAVLVATNGQKGLELAAKDPRPDVILMDVVMPEMDGYEACRKLKDNADTRDLPVIFVSANNTTEEKLAGYDVGGSDYLIKPVQPEELLHKVRVAIENKLIYEATKNEKDMAFKTAMTAMTSAGEQGVVLEFLRHSYTIDNTQDLARQLVETLSRYDLNSSVQLRTHEAIVQDGVNMPLPPLEEELLTRLKDGGKIISKDKRAIFNFGGVSVLIKNMPDDEGKRGRLRDHLAILIEGTEVKLNSLEMQEQLSELIDNSNQALHEIEAKQKKHKAESQKIMDDMLQNVEDSFLSWGLTDEQEQVLVKVVQTGVDQSLNHFEKGLAIDEQMRTIVGRINAFVKASN